VTRRRVIWDITRTPMASALVELVEQLADHAVVLDPFERADEVGIGYDAWRIERMFALVPAQAYVAEWLSSLKEFPPRQKAATFGIDQVMDQLTTGGTGSN
jgi:hypothetical protein